MHFPALKLDQGKYLSVNNWGEPEQAPHTSRTALHMGVCICMCLFACLRPYTINLNECGYLNVTKIELMHSVGEGLLSSMTRSGDSYS